jgi:sugar/nucleoside kinase (ribokinase family)
MEAAIAGAKLARENGVKVLYDCGGLYKDVERLLELSDIMIPSEEFALAHTGTSSAKEAATKLFELYSPSIVVITQGKNGGIIYDGENLTSYPAFSVEVKDSNGSGDVFHGAFAAGLLKGFDFLKCCYFSSAVSALKCTGIGARESVPSFDEAKIFLKENGYEL